jgi:uncharacterized protein YbjT (DUF2867 family)
MENKILVIGGTGTVGRAVVSKLKSNHSDFVVLTRNEDKAEELTANGVSAVVGTLGEWPTIDSIIKEVNTIFLATSPAEDMLNLHKGLIDLAVKSNIKKIVRLSAEPANYSEGLYMYEQHAKADNYLKQSGLIYVILRPHYFMQNIFMHIESVQAQNMFAQYSGNAKIPMIDVRDIAEVASLVLTRDDFNNQTCVLTGPKAISYTDIAEEISKELGKDIRYKDLSYEKQEAGFRAFGMRDWQLSTIMGLFRIWAEKGINYPTNDFEKITNSKATSIERFIADHSQFLK